MYKKNNDPLSGNLASITRTSDALNIPLDPANTDYQQYLKWVAEGNEPLPADTE